MEVAVSHVVPGSTSDGSGLPGRPVLLRHYRVRFEPSDADGDEGLVFTSEARRLVVRGRSLGVFLDHVVPLLDGCHTLVEINGRIATHPDPPDVEATLRLLVQNRVVRDADEPALPDDLRARLGPQLSYLEEVSSDPTLVVERLAQARVAVVGLGAIGGVAATALAASGVGHVRCVDDLAVSPADPFLAQLFRLDDVGRVRTEVIGERIRAVSPATTVDLRTERLAIDDDVAAAIEGSDFVLGCLDPGLASISYKLNRACLTTGTPWSSGTASAFAGVVGPTVIPYETACYLCYQARLVACRDDPLDALADLRQQDEAKADRSVDRENLAFGAGIVGNLLALQAFQALTGTRPATAGRIVVVDFAMSTTSQHLVLRKPRCPACSPDGHV